MGALAHLLLAHVVADNKREKGHFGWNTNSARMMVEKIGTFAGVGVGGDN